MGSTTEGLAIALALVFLLAGNLLAKAPAKEEASAPYAPVVKGSNEFATALYGRLREQEGNLFFSPYSISTALAMAYTGAKGQTADEMAAVMHFEKDPAALCDGYAALIRQINGDGKDRGFQLTTANSLWGQKGYGFLPDFLARLNASFGAGLSEVDFLKDTEGARKTINAWVEKETRDKIKDLIAPGGLTDQTRLVLANAIYFKAAWLHQFEKGDTEDGDFTTAAGKKVKAPMMHQVERYLYLEGDGFQALSMGYRQSPMSMVVFLPKKADGLAAFEQSLTGEKLAGWLGALKSRRADLTLPRFKTTGMFQLAKTLAAMGMPAAFEAGKADFTGMNGGKEPLWIGAVIHKAFVDVNEEGTEAAAATAIAMAGAAMPAPEQVVVFKADHPFFFVIRDTRSGEILFMGRVTDPK